MTKQLIINADDFGMSEEVNSGTQEGICKGVITSVSVMANMPYFDDAVKFLRKHPQVSVGLHFNITEGNSVLPPKNVGTLLREDNGFYHWPMMIGRTMFHNINLKEIEKELKAQYDKLQATGLKLTHIDSHHHIHLYPSIFTVVSNFADKYKINSLRGHYFNSWNLTLGVRKKPTMTQLIVNTLLMLVNLRNSQHKHLYEINRFYDINWGKDIDMDKFIEILDNLPYGTTEFICHIAKLSKTGNVKFLGPRYNTLKLLTRADVQKHLKRNGITITPHNAYLNKPSA